MSVSMSGDCLSSLRDAVAREHTKSIASEVSVEDDPSSDTEDCEDLEDDTQASTRGDVSVDDASLGMEDDSPLDIEPSMMGSPRPDSPDGSPAVNTPQICVTGKIIKFSLYIIHLLSCRRRRGQFRGRDKPHR